MFVVRAKRRRKSETMESPSKSCKAQSRRGSRVGSVRVYMGSWAAPPVPGNQPIPPSRNGDGRPAAGAPTLPVAPLPPILQGTGPWNSFTAGRAANCETNESASRLVPRYQTKHGPRQPQSSLLRPRLDTHLSHSCPLNTTSSTRPIPMRDTAPEWSACFSELSPTATATTPVNCRIAFHRSFFLGFSTLAPASGHLQPSSHSRESRESTSQQP